MLLSKIKRSYALNEPVNGSVLHEYLESESSDLKQQSLVDFVINDPLLSQYPPSLKYRQSFLKKCIKIIESMNVEVNEKLYQIYIDLISSKNNDQERFFTVFHSSPSEADKDGTLKQNPTVIIEQNVSIIAHGTTGLHVWPACATLIEFLSSRTDLIKDKVVLELGCGVGLLGLTFLLSSEQEQRKPKEYIFTDSHRLVLDQLKRNLVYNKVQSECAFTAHLDWTLELDEHEELISNSNISNLDLILATDLIGPLVSTLSSLWSMQTKNSLSKLEMLCASTIRNEATYSVFREELAAKGFQFQCVHTAKSDPKTDNSTPDCLIEIIKIYK